ncbi:uncharacterized protein DMAD_10557 [Drosophila madeirensis]|uniref:Uncharacterized protein n=1 Tax=Drosophila madeirensis TaxID=30013 RepID=A0AAU9FA58_DROMD
MPMRRIRQSGDGRLVTLSPSVAGASCQLPAANKVKQFWPRPREPSAAKSRQVASGKVTRIQFLCSSELNPGKCDNRKGTNQQRFAEKESRFWELLIERLSDGYSGQEEAAERKPCCSGSIRGI